MLTGLVHFKGRYTENTSNLGLLGRAAKLRLDLRPMAAVQKRRPIESYLFGQISQYLRVTNISLSAGSVRKLVTR